MTESDRPNDCDMTWRVQPASERPRAYAQAVVVIGMILLVLSFESLWWSLFAAVTFFFTLNRFFLASRFTVTDEGIVASYPLRTLTMSWAEVRRCVLTDRGGHLSRRRKASRFDSVSGIHLIFGSETDVPAVQARIRSLVDAATEARRAARKERTSDASGSDIPSDGVPA